VLNENFLCKKLLTETTEMNVIKTFTNSL